MKTWILNSKEALEVLSLPPASNSLDQASLLLPGGVYTTFRTFGRTKVLHLQDHFSRLEQSAALAGKSIAINFGALRMALRQTINHYPAPELRIRLQVGLTSEIAEIFILIEDLKVPTEKDYKAGVSVLTTRGGRNNPLAKQTSFIEVAGKLRSSILADNNEILMVDEKEAILEGLSSNFFGILSGVVCTAEEGVLPGITRSIVLRVMEEMEQKFQFRPIHTPEILQMSEAFITSASRAVLPVSRINGTVIGSGAPGKITEEISRRYQQHLESELEEI